MKPIFAFALLASALPLAAGPYKFQIIDQFVPFGINNTGTVVGHVGAPLQGVFRLDHFFTNVNDPSASVGQTALIAINDHGDIVGNSFTTTGGFVHAFVLKSGVYQIIDIPGATVINPAAINNRGTVVGSYTDGTGTFGFLFKANVVQKLANPAAGINDQGEIVGNLSSGGAYLLKDGVITPITGPGGAAATVSAINNSGSILGRSTDAFVLSHGVYTSIHFPASAYFTDVNGLNNNGQITGFSIGSAGFTTFIGTPAATTGTPR